MISSLVKVGNTQIELSECTRYTVPSSVFAQMKSTSKIPSGLMSFMQDLDIGEIKTQNWPILQAQLTVPSAPFPTKSTVVVVYPSALTSRYSPFDICRGRSGSGQGICVMCCVGTTMMMELLTAGLLFLGGQMTP